MAAAFAAPLFLFSTTVDRCWSQILVSSVLNKTSFAASSTKESVIWIVVRISVSGWQMEVS